MQPHKLLRADVPRAVAASERSGALLLGRAMSWDQRFVDPIVLPRRKPLITLRDAALFISKLPKAEHDAEEWQAAMAVLLLVAEQ